MRKPSSAFEYQAHVIETALTMSQVSLFAGLAPEALLPLANVVERRHLEPGEVLCDEGDVGDAMYVVIQGSLDVVIGGVVRQHIGHGEAAGEMALVDGGPRSATLRAAEPSEIHVVDREDLLELLDAHPRLAMSLLRTLAQRVLAAQEP